MVVGTRDWDGPVPPLYQIGHILCIAGRPNERRSVSGAGTLYSTQFLYVTMPYTDVFGILAIGSPPAEVQQDEM